MRRMAIRRGCGVLLAVLALLSALVAPVVGARAETVLATGYVSASKLNMRPDPSTHQAIVATLKRGDAVNVYEVCGNWLRVDVPSLGKSGYVSGKYLTLYETNPIYGLGVTTGTVHVRSGSSATSASNGTVPSGTGLTLLQAEPNGWWKVKAQNGLEGYISKSYVKVICKSAKGGAGSPAGTTAANAATISGEGVHFRTGPSTGNKSQGLLKRGTTVTVLGSSGSWYQVKINASGKTGYVYKTFVKLASGTVTGATPTPAPVASGTSAYINASGVNFRTGGSTKYKSQGMLQRGTVVTVMDDSGAWYHIQVKSTGKTGYVYKTYVTKNAATTASGTATPTPTPNPAIAAGTSGYINASGVNFRTGPSTGNQSQGLLSRNTTVSVLGASGKWYQIQVASTSKTGYVFQKYVTLTGGATLAPSANPNGPYDAGAVN